MKGTTIDRGEVRRKRHIRLFGNGKCKLVLDVVVIAIVVVVVTEGRVVIVVVAVVGGGVVRLRMCVNQSE
jgi:hypothetical protein